MAPIATEDAALEAISKPPPGVVLPPKEIRSILEKTAGYVARNGVAFEDRIRAKESKNTKFSFLTENDPYHAFYEWRMSEIRAGRGTDVSAGREGGGAVVPAKPKGPEAPPDFHFSIRMPNISAQDLDIVKLTAFYVAKNGRTFLTTLSQREAGSYQFDFLRPQHTLYQFFSRLVDQYGELLNAHGAAAEKAEQDRIAELTKNVRDKFHLLGRAKQRADWIKHQEQQKQKVEEEAEADKLAYAEIDWHDFVVVATITFDENDDESQLPPPTSLSDLQSASLEQKSMNSLQPSNMRIEEAMPGEETYYQQPPPQSYPPQQAQYNPQQYPSQPSPAPPAALPTPPALPTTRSPMPPPSPIPSPAPGTTTNARPPQNAPMKIRSDYIPRAQAARKNAGTTICPNCNQTFPNDAISEHMRIELLDPRWREQKAKADARHSTTNLSAADVSNNLKRLASQRTDVFDSVTGQPLSEEELARRKKAASGAFDGVIAGVNDGSVKPGQAGASKAALTAQARERNAQGKSIEEQLRYIQEKAARDAAGR